MDFAISAIERMTTMTKRINPRRRPATMADVQYKLCEWKEIVAD